MENLYATVNSISSEDDMSLLRSIAKENSQIRSMLDEKVVEDGTASIGEFKQMAEKLIESIEMNSTISNSEKRKKPRPSLTITLATSVAKSEKSFSTETLTSSLRRCKIVEIDKSNQPLGLTISLNKTGKVVISRILVGSIASKYKLFRVNDQILEINDRPIAHRSLEEICKWISKRKGLIKFLLFPSINANPISYETFHVRSLFDYDPSKDPLIPCREVGLKFKRADILRIVAIHLDDEKRIVDSSADWWQAYREDSFQSTFAFLIPSERLQEERFYRNQTLQTRRRTLRLNFSPLSTHRFVSTFVTSIHHLSLIDLENIQEEPSSIIVNESDESCRFYERVFLLDASKTNGKRPVVLLGAAKVGRHQLRLRLVRSRPDLFALPITHTTRAKRPDETNDVDYHFIRESDFLEKIASHSFVEFGQYNGHFYGTSIDDIRHIVNQKEKICLLNLNGESLDRLHRTNLYPLVILIGPSSTSDHGTQEQLIEQTRSIEKTHRHRIDHSVISHDITRNFVELRNLIVRMQDNHQQWIRTCYRS